MSKRKLNSIVYGAALWALGAGDQKGVRAAERIQRALRFLSLRQVSCLPESRWFLCGLLS